MISSLRLGCFWLQEVLQLKHQLIKLINWFKFFNLVAEFRPLQNSMGEFNLASSQKIQAKSIVTKWGVFETTLFWWPRLSARSWSHDGLVQWFRWFSGFHFGGPQKASQAVNSPWKLEVPGCRWPQNKTWVTPNSRGPQWLPITGRGGTPWRIASLGGRVCWDRWCRAGKSHLILMVRNPGKIRGSQPASLGENPPPVILIPQKTPYAT